MKTLLSSLAGAATLLAVVVTNTAAMADRESDLLQAEVTRGDLPIEVELSGTFKADELDEIRMEPKSYRGELIITKLVPEGRSVKKGDTLIEFERSNIADAIEDAEADVKDKQVELAKAEADLQSWQIEHDRLKVRTTAEIKEAEGDLQKAQEEAALALSDEEQKVKSARDRLGDAQIDLEQLMLLYKERELHTQTEDILIKQERRKISNLERDLQMTEARLDIWKKFEHQREINKKQLDLDDKLAEQKKEGVKQDADKKEKEAAVAKAERSLTTAQKKVDELKIDVESLVVTAPRDGVVFYGSLDEGDGFSNVVIAGMGGGDDNMKIGGRVRTYTVLMTVAAMDRLSVKMKAREGDIQHLTAGLPITVRPDAYPALAIGGELEKVDAVASRTGFLSEVREFSVLGNYEGTYPQLRSGMNCRVTVHAGTVPDCIQVPILAVFNEGDEFYVLVVEGTKRTRRKIKIGQANASMVEVTEGLRPGERVALYDPSAR